MIGSMIGAGLGAVGSIFGGISASKAAGNVKKNLEQRETDNLAWYNRRYNEDGTQRADTLRVLNNTEELIKQRNKQAQATQAVMGGTEESVAATKAANAQALADAISQISTASEARKDQIESTYQQRNDSINDALNNIEMKKAEAITTATQGVINAGNSFFK